MRKISAMYQYSGGTAYKNTCGECKNLVTLRKGSKMIYKCLAYGKTDGHETDWKNTSIACKLFGQTPPSVPVLFQDGRGMRSGNVKISKGNLPGQMSIFDFPDFLPLRK